MAASLLATGRPTGVHATGSAGAGTRHSRGRTVSTSATIQLQPVLDFFHQFCLSVSAGQIDGFLGGGDGIVKTAAAA